MAELKLSSFRALLREARSVLKEPAFPRFEAEELLARAASQPRSWFHARWEEACPEETAHAFRLLVKRRVSGEPLQFLLGEWEFLGRTFRVDDRALIPRGETERIVEAAREVAPHAVSVLDLGTGSGILAISLALERPAATVTALDISLAALALASCNSQKFGVNTRVQFVASDWLRALTPRPHYDLAVANPPYVPLSDAPHIDKTVSEFEPWVALYGGADGLDPLRVLLRTLPAVLRPGSFFIFEFGYGQAREVSALVDESGEFDLREIRLDAAGIPRTGIASKRL